ncbi:MAG: hypothetical protein IJN51_00980 [Alistipes sp.]|nr:hypothetical protein [Rikenellaceae bacterium]MBQ6939862.1 hypothetical protein [Alistipes sp.]MBQ8853996.1 hypothetical protein [Alistipes sp.]
MTDLRTPVEKAREDKHQRICAMFLDLSNKHPDTAPHRIFGIIARAETMTVPGVKHILVTNGLYATKAK